MADGLRGKHGQPDVALMQVQELPKKDIENAQIQHHLVEERLAPGIMDKHSHAVVCFCQKLYT